MQILQELLFSLYDRWMKLARFEDSVYKVLWKPLKSKYWILWDGDGAVFPNYTAH